ncbi:polyamine-modulated factor 1-binding protein [Citrus sinensis]|uniref:Polyamine-modulated factor 1-binding protein n=1 Tax=Citrus sinensis TaxID=2711 RepID=A0ACB8NPI0_CITSI|nr:polyamine-modulated factor 1-binding protein [Citrus sinensis]KAH9799430.1 polyamine-modulated factor 1-binding protein [Citrus sinensis]
MANSPSQIDTQIVDVQSSEVESQLSSLVYGSFSYTRFTFSRCFPQFQNSNHTGFVHSSEIDQNSSGIMEEVEKCKNLAFERKKSLEEEKERFQKAAFAVLDMLNDRD